MRTYTTMLLILFFSASFSQEQFSISNVRLSKESSFKANEILTAHVNYLSDGSEVQIVATPLYEGKEIKNSTSTPSPILKGKQGKTTCSFTLHETGKTDHIRFRIIQTKTSLMLHEFVYEKEVVFTGTTTPVSIQMDIEYDENGEAFLFGTIKNTSSKPLEKLMMDLPLNNVQINSSAGISLKENEDGILLYSDLWRTPLPSQASKDFVLHLTMEEGFTFPNTCIFNNTPIVLNINEEKYIQTENLALSEIDMNILSEWENGCIVEFEIDEALTDKEMIAYMGNIEPVDSWGTNITSKNDSLTFKNVAQSFGLIASTEGKGLKMPKKIRVDDQFIPVVKNDKQNVKKSKVKPIVRDAVFAFDLIEGGPTRVSITNADGEEIDVVVEETIDAGFHTFRWTPKTLTEVLYFYKLESNGGVLTGQILY